MQDLGQKLSTALDLAQIKEIAEHSLSKNLNADVWLYFPDTAATQASSTIIMSNKEKIIS
jgi:two-component system, OmpR family, sensor histidine kinase KdpD